MSSEIIEVCQDCGHVIDPIRVRHGTTIYEIRLCQRDECLFGMGRAAERWRDARPAYPLHTYWLHTPITTDISSAFRITGY